MTANLLTEVCSDVCVEPELQPLNGEQMEYATSITQDGARLDIAANGLWGGRHERTFFDVCACFQPTRPLKQEHTALGLLQETREVKKTSL